MKIALYLAFLFSIHFEWVFAIPTRSDLVQSLDDIPLSNEEQEMTLIAMPSAKSFKIKRNIAKKSKLLETMMNNAVGETEFQIPLAPQQLEMTIDYMNDPKEALIRWKLDMDRFSQQFSLALYYMNDTKNRQHLWTAKLFIDLINAANYLDIEAMLKDMLRPLCRAYSQTNSRFDTLQLMQTIETFEKIIPEQLFAPLLHCIARNAPENWNRREEALEKTRNLYAECQLDQNSFFGPTTNVVDLWMITNPSPDCLKHFTRNHLKHVVDPDFYLEFTCVGDFDAVADILISLDLNIAWIMDKSNDAGTHLELPELFSRVEKMPNLIHIEIECSQHIVDMSQFPETPNLQRLNIQNCQLQKLSHFLQQDFPELTVLDLSTNGIDDIGILFMPKLDSLRLNDNHIVDIGDLFHSHLPELSDLRLNGNQIRTIPPIPFTNLESLKLNDNRINDISGLLNSPLEKLTHLELKNNGDISEIQMNQLTKF